MAYGTETIFQIKSTAPSLTPLIDYLQEDLLLASKVDGLVEAACDLFCPSNPLINFRQGEVSETGKAQFEEIFPAKLARFAKQFDRYVGPFFFRDALWHCHFGAFNRFDKA